MHINVEKVMTLEEYNSLQDGDKVSLVDDIESIARSEYNYVVKNNIYSKGTIYEVSIEDGALNSRGWVRIKSVNNGQPDHG